MRSNKRSGPAYLSTYTVVLFVLPLHTRRCCLTCLILPGLLIKSTVVLSLLLIKSTVVLSLLLIKSTVVLSLLLIKSTV
jgi:hypothetical protein